MSRPSWAPPPPGARVRKVRGKQVWTVEYVTGAPTDLRDEHGNLLGRWLYQVGFFDRNGTRLNVHSVYAAADAMLTAMAREAADEPPGEAMHSWEAGRPRSHKTADARADGQWGVGPSDHSSCHKAIEYRERPPEGYLPDPVDKSAAIIGTLIHDAVTEARRSRYPWRKFSLAVDIPGLDRPGEVDEYDPIIGRVTDYKSGGTYKWDKVGKYGPPDSEWKQVLTYGLGLDDAGHTVTEVELLYVNRENGQWERFVRPYSRVSALAAVAELHAIVDALDSGHPLPRVRAGDDLLGPTVNALCARYCPAVRHCWNLDEIPPERTPEGYLLVRDDTDGAITATLTEYDDARTIEGAARKRKDYTRALLEGLEPGRYGNMTLNWTGGNLGEPKPDPAARAAQLESEMLAAIAEQRPPVNPDGLPVPTVRKTSPVTIQVKPVRAATLEAEARQEGAA